MSISVDFGVTVAFLRKVYLLFSWFDGLRSLAVEVRYLSITAVLERDRKLKAGKK